MRPYKYILTAAMLAAGAIGLKSCLKAQAETVDADAQLGIEKRRLAIAL